MDHQFNARGMDSKNQETELVCEDTFTARILSCDDAADVGRVVAEAGREFLARLTARQNGSLLFTFSYLGLQPYN